jgi:outer membrane protein
MMNPNSIRIPVVCLALCLSSLGLAQNLTLDEALRLARLNNGDIRAAALDVQAANARVKQARSAFFPTITPFVEYNNRRSTTDTSLGNVISKFDGWTTGIDATWNILDAGQKDFTLRGAQRSEEATRFDATQLLRRTLFTVHQQYYEALRAQELLRVGQSQVDRTQKIYDQAEFGSRPEIGSVAKKDVYQARADLLNAKVELLRIKNLTSTTQCALKATIGWNGAEPLPPLEKAPELVDVPEIPPMETVVEEGLRTRPDLQSERRRVDVQYFSWKRAERDAGFSFDLDLTYSRNFSPNTDDSRNLRLLVTYPLFDGGRLREQAREAKLNYQAAQARLVQSERLARAEIESAYAENAQNIERLNASKQALEAAQVNYNAAIAAQREGANDVIQVLTAQVSLVTAESNYIEATYDYYVSDANLRLVSGRPIAGELER